jgi:hypothetical protein
MIARTSVHKLSAETRSYELGKVSNGLYFLRTAAHFARKLGSGDQYAKIANRQIFPYPQLLISLTNMPAKAELIEEKVPEQVVVALQYCLTRAH